MKTDSQEMRKAFELAVKEIVAVLERKKDITDITKVAAGTLGNYTRIKSTEVHEMGLK